MKKKKYPCIESMTAIQKGTLKIRVWREEKEVKDYYDNKDIESLVEEMDKNSYYGLSQSDISRVSTEIARLSRVNAVEVKDVYDNGVVIYTNWP